MECHSGKPFQIFCVQQFLSFAALFLFSAWNFMLASVSYVNLNYLACAAEFASAMLVASIKTCKIHAFN